MHQDAFRRRFESGFDTFAGLPMEAARQDFCRALSHRLD